MRLRRRATNKDVEKQVLIGLITSDKICHSLRSLLNPKLFQMDLGQTVSKWIKDYYGLYNRAPKNDIQEIYLAERHNLNEETSQDIAEFLQTLSQNYLEDPPNEDYLLDRALIYLDEQSMLAGIKEATILIESNRGDKSTLAAARAALGKHKNVVITTPSITLTPDKIDEAMAEDENPLVRFREPMGTFLGPLHKGYLIGIMAAMKKGKTFLLQQMVTECLENRLRVVFISLEMPWKKLAKRFSQQIGCFAVEDGSYDFPVFDCQRNQANKCDKPQRTCNVRKGEEGYLYCYSCQEGKNGLVLTTDMVKVVRPGITSQNAKKEWDKFNTHYGKDKLRLITYPMFSANLSKIANDLDALEWNEGFIPDVIALDYPEICAPENNNSHEKEYVSIGERWKTLKGMAEERQVLIFAPIQTDRAGTEASHLKMKNTAGYIQLIAHLDKCITLNQSESDYNKRIMRIGKIADRWEDSYMTKEIRALTQLQCGQPFINGIIVNKEMG